MSERDNFTELIRYTIDNMLQSGGITTGQPDNVVDLKFERFVWEYYEARIL